MKPRPVGFVVPFLLLITMLPVPSRAEYRDNPTVRDQTFVLSLVLDGDDVGLFAMGMVSGLRLEPVITTQPNGAVGVNGTKPTFVTLEIGVGLPFAHQWIDDFINNRPAKNAVVVKRNRGYEALEPIDLGVAPIQQVVIPARVKKGYHEPGQNLLIPGAFKVLVQPTQMRWSGRVPPFNQAPYSMEIAEGRAIASLQNARDSLLGNFKVTMAGLDTSRIYSIPEITIVKGKAGAEVLPFKLTVPAHATDWNKWAEDVLLDGKKDTRKLTIEFLSKDDRWTLMSLELAVDVIGIDLAENREYTLLARSVRIVPGKAPPSKRDVPIKRPAPSP